MDAWIKILALAKHYDVQLVGMDEPENRFPPVRRPSPTGTEHIEVRG
jgi:hypothetical protein